jgi:hypothetical protein
MWEIDFLEKQNKMRKTLILIFLFGFLSHANAQSEIKSKVLKKDFERFLTTKVSKIVLISFEPEKRLMTLEGDPEEYEYYQGTIIHKGIIDTIRINNRKDLEKKYHNKLVKILFNTSEEFIEFTECYSPHNGVFFYDSNDKMIGFLEICFNCAKVVEHFGMPNIGYLTIDQFERLMSFFEKRGVKSRYDW